MTGPFSQPTFSRRGESKELFIEGAALTEIAKKWGTPTYVYSRAEILSAFQQYREGVGEQGLVCVSAKANFNLSVLAELAKAGAGFDVVSGGELARVIAAGGEGGKCVFSGVGKSRAEILQALRAGILMFNVEAVAELETINALAKSEGRRAPVALRINPDVDAKTHPYISTGMAEHKFGVPLAEAAEIYKNSSRFENVDFVGVDCHIGSMITDLSAFEEAFNRVREFVSQVKDACPKLQYLDLGGGLAVSYHTQVPAGEPSLASYSVAEYTKIIRKVFGESGYTIIIEPGRSIFANAGVLLTEVLLVKRTPSKNFVVVDAGFTELIRPTLYEAYHEIAPVSLGVARRDVTVDVVGPVCESGDCFAHDRLIPEVKEGDLVVLGSAGAYGFTMASNYNARPRPPEILVDGDRIKLVRPREQVADLFRAELEILKG